jgi:GDPmannose 4,6-dehydratase
MKKALIFGITGQDGSYLAELLLRKGYSVTGVTRRVSVNTLSRIDHILPELNIVEGDITDGFNVSKIIEEVKPDEVYNLAAQSHVGTSFKQPNLTWDITGAGVLNVLEAIRYSPRKDEIRFYQASSSEMFGKNYTTAKTPSLKLDRSFRGSVVVDNPTGEGVYEYKKYQDEDTPFVPQSPYAIAKIGEFVEWRSDDEYPFWIASVEDAPDVIYKRTSYAAEDQRFSKDTFPKLRLGNLDAKRDWGHAEDYVNAMWLMLQQETPDDYVVATGETYSVRDFLDAAFDVVEIDDWSNLVVIDPQFYRPAEVDHLLGIPTKAERDLGWERRVSFSDLAKRMVEHDVKEARLQRPSLQRI